VNSAFGSKVKNMDTPLPSSIAPEVALHLGYYVYLYTDPRSGKPFYVGKGRGQRALSHLSAEGESRKVNLLRELKEQGLVPQIDILAHALPDEETALRIEASVIDLLGLDGLSNEVRGWRSIQLGRMSLKELVMYYAATPVDIDDPVLLIRINRLYRHGMLSLDLYEATRGVWKVGELRNEAKFAFALFEGVVREVYEIHSWHPAGTNHYVSRPKEDVAIPGRWEFVGKIASDEIRNKYVDHSVKKYLPAKAQNPIGYVNINDRTGR
jgi:hypothetical protein